MSHRNRFDSRDSKWEIATAKREIVTFLLSRHRSSLIGVQILLISGMPVTSWIWLILAARSSGVTLVSTGLDDEVEAVAWKTNGAAGEKNYWRTALAIGNVAGPYTGAGLAAHV